METHPDLGHCKLVVVHASLLLHMMFLLEVSGTTTGAGCTHQCMLFSFKNRHQNPKCEIVDFQSYVYNSNICRTSQKCLNPQMPTQKCSDRYEWHACMRELGSFQHCSGSGHFVPECIYQHTRAFNQSHSNIFAGTAYCKPNTLLVFSKWYFPRTVDQKLSTG